MSQEDKVARHQTRTAANWQAGTDAPVIFRNRDSFDENTRNDWREASCCRDRRTREDRPRRSGTCSVPTANGGERSHVPGLGLRWGALAASLVCRSRRRLVLAGTLAASSRVGAQARPVSTSPRALRVTLARLASPSRHDLALRDAAFLLTLVRLPSGSARLTEEPSGDSHLLSTAAQSIGDPNLVDLHSFFVAPQNAWTLYRYERSHPPSGSTSRGGYNGYGTASTYGNTDEWFVSYSWLPVEALLDSRVLVISIAALPGRRSGIHVDAQVTWLPAKPAGDIVPTGAKVLTAVLSAGRTPASPATPL